MSDAPATTDAVAPGGIFLSSPDPERLARWFREALGVEMQSTDDGAMALMSCGGADICVLGIQKARPDAPTNPVADVAAEPYGRQPMMANLRVPDLDATVARLQAAGAGVVGPRDYPPMGRFAWTRTPDGHDIELWQP